VQLSVHYTQMALLQAQTLRAQAAQRHAAAILADAEAERVAATDRTSIVQGQFALNMGMGVGLLSGI
jgi:hypothetical protein